MNFCICLSDKFLKPCFCCEFVSLVSLCSLVLFFFSPYVVSSKATCQENSKLLLVCCQNHRLCLPDKLVLIKEGCLNRYMAIVTSCLDQ